MSRAERVVVQLGKSAGAANNQLRKQLLFKYVQAVGDHFCFKCEAEIETVDDFSIEHKLPWEGRDAALFWDLDNIAFSHVRCNRPHEYRGASEKLRKISPEGMSWCSVCKLHKPTEAFCLKRAKWNGYNGECRACQKAYKDARRSTNK